MKINSTYENVFHHWCPLFGGLPPHSTFPSEPSYRCQLIIRDARDIWQVPAQFQFWVNLDLRASCPDLKDYPSELITALNRSMVRPTLSIDDIKYYPKERIASARSIFDTYHAVCEHSIIQDARTDYFRRDDGTVKPINTIVSVLNSAIEDSRDMLTRDLRIMGFNNVYDIEEGIPDYAFIAMFAISEAWGVLRNVLYYGESEDDLLMRDSIQNATDLLTKARLMADAEDVEFGKKRRRQVQEFATRLRATEKALLFKDECQAAANEILHSRKKKPTGRQLTELVLEKMGLDKKRYESVRKNIGPFLKNVGK